MCSAVIIGIMDFSFFFLFLFFLTCSMPVYYFQFLWFHVYFMCLGLIIFSLNAFDVALLFVFVCLFVCFGLSCLFFTCFI